MDRFEKLAQMTQTVEAYLKTCITPFDNEQKSIYEAMAYSLYAGGKRIRPVLAMACCEALGGEEEAVMPFAAAVEMIHTYSLIHDDLPCMDDDDLRRGRPTNHKVFGEAEAVLAGDALLTEAFSQITQNTKLPADKTLKILQLLSHHAGTEGMIGGQVIDMESEGRKIAADRLYQMHRLKTGALIEAACLAGVICAGGKAKDLENFGAYAINLGLAFQIKDDILDVESTAEVLGKPVGSDAAEQKTTFVSLHGLESSKKMLEDYTLKAAKSLAVYGERADFLLFLADYLCKREN